MEKERKEKFRKKVGKIVERLRLEKGLSRKELGVQLGYGENAAVQAVSRFENGRAGIPKAKIEMMIQLLGMENVDFGLESTKSLKNFISASGFLGFPVHPMGKAMLDYIDNREAEAGMDAVSDQYDEVDEAGDEPDSVGYFNVARLMNLYRTGISKKAYSLLEVLEVIDSLCGENDSTFADVLATLNISAEDAYNEIEAAIVKKLKKTE
jgi:transcriptional regulator with XRE-family HTH domain